MKYRRGNTSESPTPHLARVMFPVLELWRESTTDDRTVGLSIMHKIVREMTGTLLVGSLWKQAINLQGNNNDSSQGNKGHPLLPVVISLSHSSIGWKEKYFVSHHTRNHRQEVLQPANLICNHLSLQRKEYNFVFYISHFHVTPVEVERKSERGNAGMKFSRTGWNVFKKKISSSTSALA